MPKTRFLKCPKREKLVPESIFLSAQIGNFWCPKREFKSPIVFFPIINRNNASNKPIIQKKSGSNPVQLYNVCQFSIFFFLFFLNHSIIFINQLKTTQFIHIISFPILDTSTSSKLIAFPIQPFFQGLLSYFKI